MSITAGAAQRALDARARHVPRGVSVAHPIVVDRAEGTRVWDVEGREYLDFVGGIGVLNVGHRHPRVVAAVKRQLDRVMHTAFQVASYEPYIELAARLNGRVGPPGAFKTVLFTTGVEATENAVKIARACTNRPAVIAFGGAFHGRTVMGLTLTAPNAMYRQNFGPFAPDVHHVPFPSEYRGISTASALQALQALFTSEAPPERVAAILIEPQQGEGGFIPAPAPFMHELRRLCTEHGIVLVIDEIQCGFGRTGRLFAYEHYGIEPDLITIAKSIGGGLPLSGVIGRTAMMDAPQPGGLGGTYAGNPLACAAALAVLDIFDEDDLLGQARRQGDQMRAALEALQRRYPCIGDVRGLGAMLAIELVKDPQTREPDADLAQRIVDRAREHGLLLLKAGPDKNVIRFLPPLTTPPDELAMGLERLARSVDEATR